MTFLPTPTSIWWVGYSAVFKVFMCLSVCLFVCFFPHDISKTAAARITKLYVEMFTMSPRNILFWGRKVRGQGHEPQNRVGVGYCTLVNAGFF